MNANVSEQGGLLRVTLSAREWRARVAVLKEGNSRYGEGFSRISGRDVLNGGPNQPAEVFRSRDFLVQVFHETGCVRMSVNRTMINRFGSWLADISWEELQVIKRRVGYGDRVAVEIFPRDEDVVNVANMRHLWVLPEGEGVPFGWRKNGVTASTEAAKACTPNSFTEPTEVGTPTLN